MSSLSRYPVVHVRNTLHESLFHFFPLFPLADFTIVLDKSFVAAGDVLTSACPFVQPYSAIAPMHTSDSSVDAQVEASVDFLLLLPQHICFASCILAYCQRCMLASG